MIRRLVGALTLVAIGTCVPVATASAQSASWYDGPCTDNVGITVVIDFHELGGGVNVRCASGPVTTALDALDQAGVSWESARRFPGLVCRIAGKPGPETEACGNAPPLSAYWSYWIAPRGGEWCYSTVGAGNRTPPPGTIEGWSFALNRASVDTPPPGYEPPPPIDGQPPNPLRGADCGTPTSNTTAPPVATAVPTTVPLPPAQTSPPTATDAAVDVPTATVTPSPAASTAAVGSSSTTSPVTSTSASRSSTTSSPARSSTTSSTERVSGSIDPSDDTATSTQAASESTVLGTVDLGDDGRDQGGLGAATVVGVVLAAGLVGAGTWAARRRRIAPP